MENVAYKEDYKEELLDGNIVLMSPCPSINHNIIAGNIYSIFSNYLEDKKCMVFQDGAELKISEKDRFVPDMMVVCNKDIIKDKYIEGTPDLIVEVLSTSTQKNDKCYKKEVYERIGVKEYWIVNPKDFSIEVYILEKENYRNNNVYVYYTKSELEEMTEEETENIETEFRCSLFEDLKIEIARVFHKVII